MNPNKLTNQLKDIYEDKLESVILYGSAADGEFQEGLSDYNIIIILKDLAPIEIAKSNKLIKKWAKNNPLPLFFTSQIIKEAADVFPIEFFDILERHKVIHGIDPFQGIKIDAKNLRHQCEHELRSKLLTIRPRFAIIADRPKDVIKLILDSSSSFFAIFSGILRLAGARPKNQKRELAEQLAKLIGFDPTIFIEIVDVRKNELIWKKEEALEKFEQYLTSLQAVVNYVNKI